MTNADPNFLVIGVQKGATTWMYRNLKHHPEALTPTPDEVHFFNKKANYQKGLDWYRSNFPGYAGQKAVGEFTPNYFWTSEDKQEIEAHGLNLDIPALVKQHYPDIKLVVSFRNPVKRAISAYRHLIRFGPIRPSDRILDVGHQFGILSMGFYDQHLERWLRHFPREQFLFLLFEDDVNKAPEATLTTLYNYLGIDPTVKTGAEMDKVNTMQGDFHARVCHYTNRYVAKVLNKALPSAITKAKMWDIPITDSDVAKLKEIYAGQAEKLSKMIGREVNWGF